MHSWIDNLQKFLTEWNTVPLTQNNFYPKYLQWTLLGWVSFVSSSFDINTSSVIVLYIYNQNQFYSFKAYYNMAFDLQKDVINGHRRNIQLFHFSINMEQILDKNINMQG